MNQLKIISSTTRPGRKGVYIENWITEIAKKEEGFNVELLDLSKIGLPLMDEPNHPSLQKYEKDHTKKWSATIAAADAFIIVASEYNFSFPAPIKNALDYLFKEWGYKPVAFVSYGGQSGGLRSVQMLKQVVTTLKMVPLTEAVAFPFFEKTIKENVFTPPEYATPSANAMLKELLRWSENLKLMRNNPK
ncbi:MAG: NAD(P)H-dependent oxidoreductase [Flavitalea sp.]